jgi:hypothetical protein
MASPIRNIMDRPLVSKSRLDVLILYVTAAHACED